MASKGIKLLSCITLLMGTLSGILSKGDNGLEQRISVNQWESQLGDDEAFTLYSKQEAEVRQYIKEELRGGQIESIKNVEGNFVYLISAIEERVLENGDHSKVKVYYTLNYLGEEDVENIPKEKIKLEKLQHFYMPQFSTIPYIDDMSRGEKDKVKALLEVIFSKDAKFWKIYESKWLEGFSVWINFLKEAPLLGSQLIVEEATYKENYGQTLNDSFSGERLTPNWGEMTYEVLPYTTKNNHYFTIKIPVQVLREEENRLYYNYHYLVGTSGNNIVSFKFLRRELLTK